eukprot:2686037-Rhodomonas_salina.3
MYLHTPTHQKEYGALHAHTTPYARVCTASDAYLGTGFSTDVGDWYWQAVGESIRGMMQAVAARSSWSLPPPSIL